MIPKYERLKEEIRREIKNKPIGYFIGSERGLAKARGVSTITVRRALQDLANEELIYRERGRGTFVANSAVSGSKVTASNIVLIVPAIRYSFYRRIFEEAEEITFKRGYNLIVYNHYELHEKGIEYTRRLARESKNIGGVIVAYACPGHVKIIKEGNHSLGMELLEWCFEGDNTIDCVICDDEKGGQLATEHLIGLGVEDCLAIGYQKGCYTQERRFSGYLKVMKERNLSLEKPNFLSVYLPRMML
jgi:DNA-binding LacI/PurR family transcriptional regulator